jgi:hypothetical protein
MRNYLIRTLALVFGLLSSAAPAAAQTFPSVPSGTIIGRTAIGTGPAQAIPITTLIASMLNPLTVTSVNTASVIYRGSTSGTATVSAQAVAGTPVIKWPTTSGTVPTTATLPIVLDAVTGNVACSTCVVSGVGYVSSIAGNTGAFTLGYGITNSGNEIRMRTGAVIGSKSATPYTNNTALSALIPLDDTAPTSSEGTEILTMSYTPIVSTSTLRCRFRGTVSNGAADNVVASIFQGATNFGSQMINVAGANTKHAFFIEAEYAPGAIAAQTISVRVGGGTTAIYFNGGSAGRLLGGTQAATLTCEEIAP